MTRLRTAVVALVVLGAAVGGIGLVVAMGGSGPSQSGSPTASIVHDGEDLTLAAGPDQTLDGETSLTAGERVRIRLTSRGESPFLRSANATVARDGTFTGEFDLTEVAAGSEFNATVFHDGAEIGNRTGRVVECSDCEETGTRDGTTETTSGASADGTRIRHDGDVLRLSAGPGQTVTGESDLEPGTVLTVRVRSASTSAPFLYTAEGTVTEDGTFEATLDLSEARPNTSFEAAVLYDGESLAEATGVVVRCESDCEPTPEESGDEEWDAGAAAVDTSAVGISSIARGVSGGTVPINVSVGDRETAAVSIGGNSVNYVLNATVRDGDDDGLVRLRFDTAAGGHDETTVTTASVADSVEVQYETDHPERYGALDPAGYQMRVYAAERTGEQLAGNGRLVLLAGSGGESGDSESGSGDSTAVEGDSTDAEPADDVGLEHSIVRVPSGQQGTLRVSVADADAVTLAFGGSDSGFRLNATLRDGNGDGEVVALFDTTAVGDDQRAALLPSDSADGVEITSERLGSSSLSPGPYDIDVYRGPSASGRATDVGTLLVAESTQSNQSSPENDSTAGNQSALLGGGALVAGGLLAVVGLGFLLGLFRN